MDGLTAREWEVSLALLFLPGYEAVAQRYQLAVTTVERYAKRIRQKLGARTQPDAMARVQAELVAQLGVAPTPLRSFAE